MKSKVQSPKSKVQGPESKVWSLKSKVLSVAAMGALLAAVACGCSTTAPPTGAEQYLYDIKTNLVAQVVLQTNVVTITNTVPVTAVTWQTNSQNIVTYTTNQVQVMVPSYQTNVVTVTNLAPTYTLTPNANAQTAAGIAGTLTNLGLPGAGSLVTMGLLGLAAAWAGIRNRQYAGQASTAQQVSGVLAQNIATFMQVLQQTPQGQQLAPLLQNYLNTHQAEAGVIQQVAGLASQVDPLAAAGAAQQILTALTALTGTAAGPAAKS